MKNYSGVLCTRTHCTLFALADPFKAGHLYLLMYLFHLSLLHAKQLHKVEREGQNATYYLHT